MATKEKLIPCEVRELPKGNGLPLFREQQKALGALDLALKI